MNALTDRDSHLKALLVELPEHPLNRVSAVAKIYAELRKAAAKELKPAIESLINGAKALSYDDKREISLAINHTLADARLAILNPNTQIPGTLISTRSRPDSHVSKLYLQDSHAIDGKRHAWALDDKGSIEIELVETPRRPRRTGLQPSTG